MIFTNILFCAVARKGSRILELKYSRIATVGYIALFRRQFLAMPHEPKRFFFTILGKHLQQEQ